MIQEIAQWSAAAVPKTLLRLFGYWTGCLLIPVFTSEWLRVQKLSGDARSPSRRSERMAYRDPDGQFTLIQESACLFGIVFWIIAVILAIILYRHHSS